MPKVDIVLNIIQSAMTYANDPNVNKLFADLAFLRNTYQWICQNQDDNGDVMALRAVLWAKGEGPKPAWITQGGL